MRTPSDGSGAAPTVVLRVLTPAAYAALESPEGNWRSEEIAAEATAADRFFQGVDARGRHVGCVWVTPLPDRWWPYVVAPEATWYLHQLTVTAARRSQGYGRALLAATEAELAAAGVAELCLDVFHTNHVARGLYTSAGFAVAYRAETKTGMRKRLAVGST